MNYSSYRPKQLTVDKLDSMMSFMFESNGNIGWFASIILAVKMALCLAYLIARNKLVDIEMQIIKQEYERDQKKKHDDLNKT